MLGKSGFQTQRSQRSQRKARQSSVTSVTSVFQLLLSSYSVDRSSSRQSLYPRWFKLLILLRPLPCTRLSSCASAPRRLRRRQLAHELVEERQPLVERLHAQLLVA